jgi:SynChlorMet cassette protein ScmD
VSNGEKPIRNPYVVLREEFDDWAVLFNPDTGHGFGLNPTGVYLWKLLDGEHTIDDVLGALQRDADDIPPGADEHLIAFLEQLTEQGLA